MNYEFYNQYTLSDKMMKEYVNRTQCIAYRVVGVLVILAAIFRVALNLTKGSSEHTLMFIIAGVGGIFLLIASPLLMTKELLGNYDKKFKKSRPLVTVYFADDITKKEGTETETIEYYRLTRVVTTKNTIALMIGSKKAVLLARDGFNGTTEAEFKAFIKEKYPLVKGV